MSTHRLERTQVVPGEIDQVFEFFENPLNLEQITPPWLRFHVLDSTDERVRVGTEIAYRLYWNGLRMGWRSRISEYQRNERFADEMLRGPYKHWYHTHLFSPASEGVEIVDIVEYELPLGAIGDVVHAAIVRKQLESIFDYRRAMIGTLFPAGAGASSARATT